MKIRILLGFCILLLLGQSQAQVIISNAVLNGSVGITSSGNNTFSGTNTFTKPIIAGTITATSFSGNAMQVGGNGVTVTNTGDYCQMGVGTKTPYGKLNVSDTNTYPGVEIARFEGNATVSSFVSVLGHGTNGDTVEGAMAAQPISSATASPTVQVSSQTMTPLSFGVGDIERARFDTNGAFNIGTKNGPNLLNVNGRLGADTARFTNGIYGQLRIADDFLAFGEPSQYVDRIPGKLSGGFSYSAGTHVSEFSRAYNPATFTISAGTYGLFTMENQVGTVGFRGVQWFHYADTLRMASINEATGDVRQLLMGFGTTNGYVGIGTVSPSAKLDVSGDIRASTTVTATNGFIIPTNALPPVLAISGVQFFCDNASTNALCAVTRIGATLVTNRLQMLPYP